MHRRRRLPLYGVLAASPKYSHLDTNEAVVSLLDNVPYIEQSNDVDIARYDMVLRCDAGSQAECDLIRLQTRL